MVLYLVIANLAAFLMYGADKRRAKKNRWRISEKALIMVALIGGSVGALGGMYLFRHKTKHVKFIIGVPVILVIQILIVYIVY